MQALSLRGSFRKKIQSGGKKQTDRVCADHGKICGKRWKLLDCLIWSGSCENVLSEEVDSLLEEYPAPW